MGQKVTKTDFEWESSNVVHSKRRLEILKKHPGKFLDLSRSKIKVSFAEIKQLFGPDPVFKWKCTGIVLTQIVSLFLLQNQPIWVLLILAYGFGGTLNHILMLAQHEICHNLCFGQGR
jgi:sphingolipid 4-desaturase/C4-monooxygenase